VFVLARADVTAVKDGLIAMVVTIAGLALLTVAEVADSTLVRQVYLGTAH